MKKTLKNFLLPLAASTIFASMMAYAQEDPVLLKVNGTDITKSDLEALHDNLQDPWRQYEFESILPMLQDFAIEMNLSEKYALDHKLNESEDYKNRVKIIERSILRAMASEKYVEENLTDERVKNVYDEQIQLIEPEEERKLRHILLDTEEEALEVIKQLESGKDFAELAEELSIGPSKENGGDLGWATANSFIPEFSEAAWKLEKNEYTKEPVESSFGFHVIWAEDARMEELPAFEDIKDLLKAELAQALDAEFINLVLKDAEIERYDITGENLVTEEALDLRSGTGGYIEEAEVE